MERDSFLTSCEERFDSACGMPATEWKGPGYHSRIAPGSRVHETRLALDFALASLQRDASGDREKAARAVAAVLKLQDTEPVHDTYGIWPWLLEEPLEAMSPPDWNWADFCGARLAQMLVEHADQLSDDLIPAMRDALGHAAWAIFRRNVGPHYTNIAVMGAGVVLAAGELLDEQRLVTYGLHRLEQFQKCVLKQGDFTEYNSPTYTPVALHECERILQIVENAPAREVAEWIRRRAWQVIADHFHPGTGQWAGPHSRTYSDRLVPEHARYIAAQTGAGVQPYPGLSQHAKSPPLVRELPCPEDLLARFSALPQSNHQIRQCVSTFPYEAALPDRVCTTWFTDDACLGSVNHDILWAQRHPLIAYWRTQDDPAVVLRLRFLHDGLDYSSAVLRSAQEGPRVLTAVHLDPDRGDYHPHLDRPADGCFSAEDLRLRWEIRGNGARARRLQTGVFSLTAGSRQAVIHTLPGSFGPHEVRWEIRETREWACLDAICYHGEAMTFCPDDFGPVKLACSLELLSADEAPSPESPDIARLDNDWMKLTWGAAPSLVVDAPLTATHVP